MVMPRDAIPAVVLFIALVLCAGLTALAASGHFPPEHRGASLRAGMGRAILFGACAVSALALLVVAAAACALLPWPAAVIAAGAATLAAPLRPLPDAFVNGRAALLAFASASALLAVALLSLQ
jgi:hypothetical protein